MDDLHMDSATALSPRDGDGDAVRRGAAPRARPDPLDALAARARDDLARVAHPRMPWLEPRTGPDGRPALDVLIVGGGQSGLAVAMGLLRATVPNILVLDRAPRGAEGPWLTYARMRTLRSPKDYTGPDLDLPSLGYQAWHEARYGAAHWAALGLIAREDWAAYLLWVRDTAGIPVANGATATEIAPGPDGLLAVTVDGAVRYARKVVLATGQDGCGQWWMPPWAASLPAACRAHTADPIDFAALRGRRVAVLGAGASALDNAAAALEAGAAQVTVLCRRAAPQLVQPYRWLTFAGFLRHLSDLPDEWRWRFMSKVLGMREGFPQPTWDRCARHPNFTLLPGAAISDARHGPGGLTLDTARGPVEADFLICGTGVETDFALRPELRHMAGNIATWSDRYAPPPEEADARLGRFPYLGPDFAFLPREPGRTEWMRHVHLFGIASTMSLGPSGCSINAMTTAAPKLVRGLTEGLFRMDVERHWAALQAYDVKQAEIGAG